MLKIRGKCDHKQCYSTLFSNLQCPLHFAQQYPIPFAFPKAPHFKCRHGPSSVSIFWEETWRIATGSSKFLKLLQVVGIFFFSAVSVSLGRKWRCPLLQGKSLLLYNGLYKHPRSVTVIKVSGWLCKTDVQHPRSSVAGALCRES